MILPSTQAAENHVQFSDGQVLSESLTATTVSVPAGATVYYTGDITIRADQWIRVDGQLRAAGTGGGDNLSLLAGTFVQVSGSVVANDGAAGLSTASNANATAGDGEDAGSITIAWGAFDTFVLETGALLRAGDGGAGGPSNVTADNASAAILASVGGAGGAGGDLRLLGQSAFLYGTLRLGGGGDGGEGFAWAPWNTTPIASGELHAVGGDGGDSGELELPPGHDAVSLHNLGRLVGGSGGNGGPALSQIGDLTPIGAEGTSRWVGEPGQACRGSDGGTAEPGGQGCRGGDSTARGGAGGDGLVAGGRGGAAQAAAGQGGNGGRGGDADWFPARAGGRGGAGGEPGSGAASGGAGGSSLLVPGRGGDAYAYGGSGGNGGRGGDGAWLPGYSGSCDLPDCYGGTISGYCVSPGGAGAAGSGRYGSASPGAGGASPLLTGDSGSAQSYLGSDGAAGQAGSVPPQCPSPPEYG